MTPNPIWQKMHTKYNYNNFLFLKNVCYILILLTQTGPDKACIPSIFIKSSQFLFCESKLFCRKITKNFLSNWIVCIVRRPYWIFRPSSKLASSLQLTFTLGRFKPLPSLVALQSHHFFKPLKSNPFETLPFEKRPLSVHSMLSRI